MEYEEKLKILPWRLPVEEVERMPGVTIEDIKRARGYGRTYPTIWYEQYEKTIYGSLVVLNYIRRWKLGIIKNTVYRAELLRRVSSDIKGTEGISTRAFQIAAFWLFSSLGDFCDWERRERRKIERVIGRLPKEKKLFLGPAIKRKLLRPSRYDITCEEILLSKISHEDGKPNYGKDCKKVRRSKPNKARG